LFLSSTVGAGQKQFTAGRFGDAASVGLAKTLRDAGFPVARHARRKREREREMNAVLIATLGSCPNE
jgi:tRNA U34 5-carboxymethylaminomethyl modifying enzyme MnmG/GidA